MKVPYVIRLGIRHCAILPQLIFLIGLDTIAPYMKAKKDYYIMNDMSKLPQYMERPYVAGWPHMKYYVSLSVISVNGGAWRGELNRA